MMEIVWYNKANDDLEEIYVFYFLKSPNVANKIFNSILDEIEILKTHPEIAAIEPYWKGEEDVVRSLITKDGLFKVVYNVNFENNEILILRIWCCRADIKNLKN